MKALDNLIIFDNNLRKKIFYFLQSGGELKRDEKTARIILSMIRMTELDQFLPSANVNYIKIRFQSHFYYVEILPKKFVVIKKSFTPKEPTDV